MTWKIITFKSKIKKESASVVEITGEKLNVEKLDMQEGILVVSGKIISVQYTDKNKKEKTSIFKKFSRV